MTRSFTSCVTELWAALELGLPQIDSSGAAALEVAGRKIVLRDMPDGRHLLLTGSAGRLASDGRTAAAEARRLLETSLVYLISSRACISLLEEGPADLTVKVEALYDYRNAYLDSLVSLLHEFLAVFEAAQRELTCRQSLPSRTASSALPADSVVFRP